MRICRLAISNFRGIKTAAIQIPKHCVILGGNNSGKTAIAEAFALLLGKDRLVGNPSEFDFFEGRPTATSRFNITAVVTDFSTNNPTDYPTWFHHGNGGNPVWWKEDTGEVVYELDQPAGTALALEIGICGKFDDQDCEFELRRYFVDGDIDPFTIDPFIPVPFSLIKEFGLYLLPSSRNWDRVLSLGSSTFLKLLKEHDAVPGLHVGRLKDSFRDSAIRIEEDPELKTILDGAARELISFSLMASDSSIVYRPTSLEIESIFKCLTPHIKKGDSGYIPLSKQGSGFISLQIFLILLAFAQKRRESRANFVFVGEEPELHLHPSLQSRLIHRMKGLSNQVIVTTHSPLVAALFKPSEALFLLNENGVVKSRIIKQESIHGSQMSNQARRLYQQKRKEFYETLLGRFVIIPEGLWDWQWLKLLIRIAESIAYDSDSVDEEHSGYSPSSIEICQTEESATVEMCKIFVKLRKDVAVLVDGDSEGNQKIQLIKRLPIEERPTTIIQFGVNGEIEDLVAWILEPSFSCPGPTLSAMLAGQVISISEVSKILKLSKNKGSWELHENLAWEAFENPDSKARIKQFFGNIYSILAGERSLIPGWTRQDLVPEMIALYKSDFIVGV
jgi:putative ATP-dependent endonuclease of OLD family